MTTMAPLTRWPFLINHLVTAELLVELRDLWVGLYWTRDSRGLLHLYFGGPVLVFHVVVWPQLL